MPKDGTGTKVAIMDAAEDLILEQGFAGTSIDEVIQSTGVTKGAFFHHFASKQHLARALIERFIAADQRHLTEKMSRASRLHRDPLDQLLLFVGLFIEEAEPLVEPVPGCLVGSYVYEAGLFDDEILEAMRRNLLKWRTEIRAKLDEIVAIRTPRIKVDLDSLADQITVIFEGAFILSKSLKEPGVVAAQLRHFRSYLELLFWPEPDPGGD